MFTQLPEQVRNKIVVDVKTGCWLWQEGLTKAGYGRITVDKVRDYSHRVTYQMFVGPIVNQLDHLCRVRHCCNPEHLEDVTQRENLLRGDTISARNAAVTHCPLGHAYDDENTHITVRGTRACRACSRMKANAYRAEHLDEINNRRRTRRRMNMEMVPFQVI